MLLTVMMMSNMLILCDTRQQKDLHVTSYFDTNDILWQRATLSTGDYMAIKCDILCHPYTGENYPAMRKDFSTIIDTKKDILEISNNLCKSTEHDRIKQEIWKAKELGNERFIFLIADPKVSCIDDLKGWSSHHTKVRGETLAKIMTTMSQKYGCEFLFCKKLEMGKKIIELLS